VITLYLTNHRVKQTNKTMRLRRSIQFDVNNKSFDVIFFLVNDESIVGKRTSMIKCVPIDKNERTLKARSRIVTNAYRWIVVNYFDKRQVIVYDLTCDRSIVN
jgi:hypothetical protein